MFAVMHNSMKEVVFFTDFWGKAIGLQIAAGRTSPLVKTTFAEQLTLLESNPRVYLFLF